MNGIDWSPVINAAVLLLAALIATLRPVVVRALAAYAERVANETLGTRAYLLKEFAREAVAAAEKLGGTGAEKKAMAVNYVLRRAGEFGVAIETETVETLVEAVLGENVVK